MSNTGEPIFYAGELNDPCITNCCGSSRSFNLKILDKSGKTVLNVKRALRSSTCCLPCCLQSMEVSSCYGPIGTVKQGWSPFYDRFEVKNAHGKRVLWIQGPCRGLLCCPESEILKILSNEGKELGKISSAWPGFSKETDGPNVGLTFPKEMNVKIKGLVLAAVFMVVSIRWMVDERVLMQVICFRTSCT